MNEKRKYVVYCREVSENDGYVNVGDWHEMGTTYAVSSKRAISNIKYRNNLSEYSYGADLFNYHYEFRAEAA